MSATEPSTVKAEAERMEKRAELRLQMLKKLRPYPLRHEWVFWHERNNVDTPTNLPTPASWHQDQLKEIAHINTVQGFWQVFNNTPFETLQLRDSLHLFKKGVKPVWEDKRNVNGGAWTFRIPKAQSYEFWKEVLMMTIGEILQEVVERGDDICGVSISVRFNSHLITVWNRDGGNQKSIDAILARALESVPDEMKPRQESIYYKKHSAHKSFKSVDGQAAKPVDGQTAPTVSVTTASGDERK